MNKLSLQTNIRLYREEDWDIILDIFNRAKPDEVKGSVDIEDIVSLDKDQGLLNSFNNSIIYVADYNNKVIGYVGYHNNLISFLFTDPEYYRNGLGTKLLEFVLPLIGEKAWLLVAKTNKSAIELYKKHGFKIANEYIGKYNGKIEVSVLRLAIKPELESWKQIKI